MTYNMIASGMQCSINYLYILLIITTIGNNFFSCPKNFKIYFLSNFQICNIVSLTVVMML